MSPRLHSGETILYRGHPSWRAMLAFHLKVLAAAIAFGIAARLILGGTVETYLVILATLTAGIAIGWARRRATAYTVTSRRLTVRRGLVSREIQETRLDRIENLGYRQGPFQRLLRIGDIEFETASGTGGYTLIFAGVADPASIVHDIYTEALQ